MKPEDMNTKGDPGVPKFNNILQSADRFNPVWDLRGNGRYKQVYAMMAYKLRMLGYNLDQVADTIGVSRQTVYNWRKSHAEFEDAINGGGEAADALIAESLFKRARGYTAREVFAQYDEKGELLGTRIVEKDVPPDTAALKAWLSSRQPDIWKERREITGKVEALKLEDIMEMDSK